MAELGNRHVVQDYDLTVFLWTFWVWVVGLHVDVNISSYQGGAGEGADQRKKIFKEIFGGMVQGAVAAQKVKSTKQPTLLLDLTLPLDMPHCLQAWRKVKPSITKYAFGTLRTLGNTCLVSSQVVQGSWSIRQSHVSV